MCVGSVLKAGLSPIASSTGRAALAGGAAGLAHSLVSSASKRKRKREEAAAPKPVLEPTAALRNSSIFNT